MTIGKLAKKMQIGVETIRYYQRLGLISKPRKQESGYRQYSNDTVRKIYFIKRAKSLGFTLHEISELLSLKVNSDIQCNDIKTRAEAKIIEIEEKLCMLRRMKDSLVRLTDECAANTQISECPILEALDFQELDNEFD